MAVTYDDDPIARRRRQNRQREFRNRLILLAGLVVGLAACVVLVVVVLGRRGGGQGGPELPGVLGGVSAGREGEQWTHAELAEYLGKKGVEVKIFPAGDHAGRLTSSFVPAGDTNTERAVVVVMCANQKDAKEVAGSFGLNTFSWGRFAIAPAGNAAFADRIRKALP